MILNDLRADMQRLCPHLLHQPRALNHFRKTWIVLNICGYGQLASRLNAFDENWLKYSPGCIDRRSVPRGT